MLLTVVGLLAAACGGGDAPAATGTPSGEREERAGAVEQVEAQAEPVVEQAQSEMEEGQVTQSVAEQAEEAAETAEVVEAEFEDQSEQTITFDDQAVDRTVAALAAHREGLVVERNVLGDPSAPVLIVEYGDFQ